MAGRIHDIASRGKHPMRAVSGLHPFLINQLAGKELRDWLFYLIIRIDIKKSKRSHRTIAAVIKTGRKIVEIVEGVAADGEVRAHEVSEPQCSKNVDERLASIPGNIELSDEEREFRRQAVTPPDVHDMRDERRLVIQAAPLHFARLVGLVLEGKESEIRHATVRLQIGNEASEP